MLVGAAVCGSITGPPAGTVPAPPAPPCRPQQRLPKFKFAPGRSASRSWLCSGPRHCKTRGSGGGGGGNTQARGHSATHCRATWGRKSLQLCLLALSVRPRAGRGPHFSIRSLFGRLQLRPSSRRSPPKGPYSEVQGKTLQGELWSRRSGSSGEPGSGELVERRSRSKCPEEGAGWGWGCVPHVFPPYDRRDPWQPPPCQCVNSAWPQPTPCALLPFPPQKKQTPKQTLPHHSTLASPHHPRPGPLAAPLRPQCAGPAAPARMPWARERGQPPAFCFLHTLQLGRGRGRREPSRPRDPASRGRARARAHGDGGSALGGSARECACLRASERAGAALG